LQSGVVNPKSLAKAQAPGLVSAGGITNRFFGTWDTYKSLKATSIAAKVMRFAYVKSDENVSDILTKPLINEKFHYLVKNWLFLGPQVKK
jgi:hypothetical protein